MTSPMTFPCAFDCDHSSNEAIQKILNEAGPWTWHMGDSVWFGGLLRCAPAEGVRAEILDSEEMTEGKADALINNPRRWLAAEREQAKEGRFKIDVGVSPEARLSKEEVEGIVGALLERLGARNLTPTQGW